MLLDIVHFQFIRIMPSNHSFELHRAKQRKGSNVADMRCLTMREIYNKYVKTGEVPRSRPSEFSTRDYPAKMYGDVEIAMETYSNVLSEEMSQKEQPAASIDVKEPAAPESSE